MSTQGKNRISKRHLSRTLLASTIAKNCMYNCATASGIDQIVRSPGQLCPPGSAAAPSPAPILPFDQPSHFSTGTPVILWSLVPPHLGVWFQRRWLSRGVWFPFLILKSKYQQIALRNQTPQLTPSVGEAQTAAWPRSIKPSSDTASRQPEAKPRPSTNGCWSKRPTRFWRKMPRKSALPTAASPSPPCHTNRRKRHSGDARATTSCCWLNPGVTAQERRSGSHTAPTPASSSSSCRARPSGPDAGRSSLG